MTSDPIDEAAARAIYESMQLKRGWDDPKLNDAWKPVCLRNARACRLAILRGMLERGPLYSWLDDACKTHEVGVPMSMRHDEECPYIGRRRAHYLSVLSAEIDQLEKESP